MRHRKGNAKLGRPTDQRIALLRGLVLSLITHKRIITTTTRAKEAKRMAEKLITLGKRGDLHARRLALQTLPNKIAVKELFHNISPKFAERNGGYTRIINAGFRKGDAAPIAVLELVD
jgi:large subunit ribosomal protein L17